MYDLFFLKRLKFPETTKIIALSRNAPKKADHEDVGIYICINLVIYLFEYVYITILLNLAYMPQVNLRKKCYPNKEKQHSMTFCFMRFSTMDIFYVPLVPLLLNLTLRDQRHTQ